MGFYNDIAFLEEELAKVTKLLFLLYIGEESEKEIDEIDKFLMQNSEDYRMYANLQDNI
jgi:hypothetical protein